MFIPRIIPVLLLKNKGLVKTIKFKKTTYIGDPLNAVKIFNDLRANELVFLDITATKEKRAISTELVKKIADEAYMPFAVGGGISSIEQIKNLISNGAEKVVINTSLYSNPELIKNAVSTFGSQSIIGSIDVKKNFWDKYRIYIMDGKRKINVDLAEYVKYVQDLGVGEILINSIDADGTMKGYDNELVSLVTNLVNIPVIACGGAGMLEDIVNVIEDSGAHASAAGSLFVFHSTTKGVLINYPSSEEIINLFKTNFKNKND
ncbi:MAG: AglZ/HisF2 family acetamidino modification protein [Ignavibacteria bacterium]|jgi:cyclase